MGKKNIEEIGKIREEIMRLNHRVDMITDILGMNEDDRINDWSDKMIYFGHSSYQYQPSTIKQLEMEIDLMEAAAEAIESGESTEKSRTAMYYVRTNMKILVSLCVKQGWQAVPIEQDGELSYKINIPEEVIREFEPEREQVEEYSSVFRANYAGYFRFSRIWREARRQAVACRHGVFDLGGFYERLLAS